MNGFLGKSGYHSGAIIQDPVHSDQTCFTNTRCIGGGDSFSPTFKSSTGFFTICLSYYGRNKAETGIDAGGFYGLSSSDINAGHTWIFGSHSSMYGGN